MCPHCRGCCKTHHCSTVQSDVYCRENLPGSCDFDHGLCGLLFSYQNVINWPLLNYTLGINICSAIDKARQYSYEMLICAWKLLNIMFCWYVSLPVCFGVVVCMGFVRFAPQTVSWWFLSCCLTELIIVLLFTKMNFEQTPSGQCVHPTPRPLAPLCCLTNGVTPFLRQLGCGGTSSAGFLKNVSI